jgi:hypothetical protein
MRPNIHGSAFLVAITSAILKELLKVHEKPEGHMGEDGILKTVANFKAPKHLRKCLSRRSPREQRLAEEEKKNT